MTNTDKNKSLGVIVMLGNKSDSDIYLNEMLEELTLLAETLSINVCNKFIQKLTHPHPKTYLGSGKLSEISLFCKANKINVVLFDDDLSPSQLRNLENELKVKIYDRSLLILDIFLKRAKTAQAKTQVELARNQYLLPRLTRMWTHLERQRGGASTRGGAGEKEIETDRRVIRNQINVLKKKLEKIEQQLQTQRKSRKGIVRVALVGYTNAGKSTIMNILSKEQLYAKNELFATLDSTVRKVVIDHIPFLLSDTVGFIRKLPHTLIESFKSTLSEVKEADILLHVIDHSHPSSWEHIQVVENTLKEIGASEIPVIKVYNKVDQNQNPSYVNDLEKNLVAISAKTGQGLNDLKMILYREVKNIHLKIYPHFMQDSIY